MWFQNVTIFSGALAFTRLPMQEKNEKQMSNGLATTFYFGSLGRRNLPGIQVSPQDHRFIFLPSSSSSLLSPPYPLLIEYSNPLPSPKGKVIQLTHPVGRQMLSSSLVVPPSADAEPSESSGRQLSDEALLEEILTTVNSARSLQEFRRWQRKECFNLVRWLQLLLPLIQEIREAAPPLTTDAYRSLSLLSRAFQAARRLLRCCHDGSKIFLVMIQINLLHVPSLSSKEDGCILNAKATFRRWTARQCWGGSGPCMTR
jgi:hypothetical protein